MRPTRESVFNEKLIRMFVQIDLFLNILSCLSIRIPFLEEEKTSVYLDCN